MLDARRAAVASAKNPKELRLLLLAGSTLKQALALGRSFAAQYPDPLGNIEQALKRLPEGHTKETLLVLVEKTRREVVEVEHQAEAFRRNLENWFNDAMDRVGGWYKRWTQRVLLILATLLVLAANADTVMLVQQLSANSALRASLVAAAEDAVRTLPRPSGAEPESSAPESDTKTGEAKRDETTSSTFSKKRSPCNCPSAGRSTPRIPGTFNHRNFRSILRVGRFTKYSACWFRYWRCRWALRSGLTRSASLSTCAVPGRRQAKPAKARPSPDSLAAASNITSELALAAV